MRASEVFQRFKKFVTDDWTGTTIQLVQEIHRLATVFEGRMTRIESGEGYLDPVDMFLYRTQVMDIDAVTPLFLLLTDPSLPAIPDNELHTALQAVESWIIRRALVRGTTQRYTDILTELITDIHKNGRDQVANRLTDFLRNQTSESSYWPDNTQLTSFLEFAPIYTTLARKRLRMILEAIEDDLRGLTRNSSSKSEQPCPRGKLTVEHILPQSWRDTWGLGDSPNIEERARRVHLLGNLTLLNQKLNSSVSNGPWQGQDGKKQALDQHSVLRLNSRLTEFVDKDWMNSSIDARTSYLIERLISIWPVPEGHSVIGVSQSKVTSSQIVEIPQLLSAGLLEVGSVLEAAPARLAGRTCVVLSDGTLETDDHQNFYSPSGAGRHISGTAAVGGWHFWRVRGTDKRLNELREEYRARFNVDMDSDAEEELEDEGGTV